MKTIAFRTANYPGSRVALSLPSNYIVEWIDSSLQPEGSLKEEDGWILLPENEFIILRDSVNTEENLNQFKLDQEANKPVPPLVGLDARLAQDNG